MLESQDKAYIKQEIRDSESRMIAYFEAAIMPKFDLLADGQKILLETIETGGGVRCSIMRFESNYFRQSQS